MLAGAALLHAVLCGPAEWEYARLALYCYRRKVHDIRALEKAAGPAVQQVADVDDKCPRPRRHVVPRTAVPDL